jgi:hypothetical protein
MSTPLFLQKEFRQCRREGSKLEHATLVQRKLNRIDRICRMNRIAQAKGAFQRDPQPVNPIHLVNPVQFFRASI